MPVGIVSDSKITKLFLLLVSDINLGDNECRNTFQLENQLFDIKKFSSVLINSTEWLPGNLPNEV